MTETKRRPPSALPNRCPDGDALDRIASSMERISSELQKITPLAEGVAELNGRLMKLCNFIVGNRLKIAAFMIAAVSTPGLIAPEVAAVAKAIITAIASQTG